VVTKKKKKKKKKKKQKKQNRASRNESMTDGQNHFLLSIYKILIYQCS
jgi:hypothetical protein